MGKAFMFFSFMWLIVAIAGGVMSGNMSVATTNLTANLNSTDTTIPVKSTTGFADVGVVVIGTEKIAYSAITATTITGSLAQPMVRGASDTTAQAHIAGDRVRTLESSMMNASAQYNITVIQDATGPWAAVTIPLAVMRLIGAYLRPQTDFLGTDLQILVYLWWICIGGMVVVVGLSLAGTRRV